jgi:hypothetical protein
MPAGREGLHKRLPFWRQGPANILFTSEAAGITGGLLFLLGYSGRSIVLGGNQL